MNTHKIPCFPDEFNLMCVYLTHHCVLLTYLIIQYTEASTFH